MKMITLFLPERIIAKYDEIVKAELFPNRSEALRFGVLHFLLSLEESLCQLDLIIAKRPDIKIEELTPNDIRRIILDGKKPRKKKES